MRELVSICISRGDWEIRCQQINNRALCDTKLDTMDWRLIGGYSTDETNKIEGKLKENWESWARKGTKKCRLGHDLTNYEQKTKRIQCSVCVSADFCFDCL